jgi:outer membrane receptor protein involved in Fe transport
MDRTRWLRAGLGGGVCLAALALASPAAAQVSNSTGQGTDCQARPDDPRCTGITETPAPDASSGTIVVTGSRIARQDYEANSPIVTIDETFLEQSSTAAVEEQLNRLPQFVVSQSSTTLNGVSGTGGPVAAGTSIQPSAVSTPGASTVSLRGVGANRTLVLIDGRRGTPGNANGTVDVSTIPSAALERVEIISGGASATYGADAIAGVTNFILKRDFEGVELDAQGGISDEGNGFEYQLSGMVGADIEGGRGNVSLAMSLNTREELYQRDNPNYPRLWANPETTVGSAAALGVGRPGIAFPTGTFLANRINPATGAPIAPGAQACEGPVANPDPRRCVITSYFAGTTPGVPNNITAVYLNEDGTLFGGVNNFASRGAGEFFKPWPELDERNGYFFKTLTSGTLVAVTANTVQTVPTDRYNFLARGNYEINDWIGVFGQGMFSNSTTYTQLEASTAGDLFIPWGTDKYTGTIAGNPAAPGQPANPVYQNPYVPSAVIATQSVVNGQIVTTFAPNPAFINIYRGILPCATPGSAGYNPTGCTNTQVFQAVVPDSIESLLNARANPNARVQLAGPLPNPRQSYQEVQTYTLVAGLEGTVPGMDWTWEAFVNHGISRTDSRQTGYYSLNRLRGVISAPNFGQNFRATGNPFNNGSGATTGTCTSGLNFFGGFERISQDCREAIAEDNSSKGTSRQTIFEANLQGGLFEIPWTGDELRFAAGASYRELRYEFIPAASTTIGREFGDQIIGGPPNSIMENTGINAREVYGELLIPVLADLPLVESFNLEVGGRVSTYSPGGTSYTYKILGDWEVTPWLRLRGGYNRAERTPNVAEQLLERQVGISIDAIGDGCSTRNGNTFSANPTTNTANALDVQAVCLELMARDNNGIYAPITNPDGTPNANSFYNPADAQARQGTGTIFSNAPRVGNAVYIRDYNANVAALQSEKADTWTVGAVIRSPFDSGPLSRLNLTIDYFNITINDPISIIGAGAQLLRCISPNYNPAAAGVAAGATSPAGLNTPEIRARAQAAIENPDSTCADVFRFRSDGVGGETGGFRVNDVISTYGNEGQIKLAGIDANLSWSIPAGPGRLSVNLNGSYTLDSSIRAFDGQPLIDYTGTTGTGALGVSTGSSFAYRLFGTLGYNVGPASISLQWQHIPRTEDGDEARFLNGLAPAGTDNSGLPAYNLFHLNASYQVNDALRLRFGADNVFDIEPPITGIDTNIDRSLGEVPGGNYSLFHDVQGRRFSFGANVSF